MSTTIKTQSKKTRPAQRSEYLQGSAFDRIKYFYLGKISEDRLTDKEKALMKRWENVWRLYQRHLKGSVAIQYHLENNKREGNEISFTTGWRDLQNAAKIWGKITRLDRQAKLILLDEMATDVFLDAREAGELGEMNRAISNLVKINEQVEDYLEEAREPHKYELHIHVNGEKKALDLNKLPVQNQQYIPVLESLEAEETDDESIAELLDESDTDAPEIQ